MTQDDRTPVLHFNEEVQAADSQPDLDELQLREENSRAVMQQLIDLGYMDAGLDI